MRKLLRHLRAAFSPAHLSTLPAAARPVIRIVAGVCIDCDAKTAINAAGCCCRCGSSSVFIPGARRLPSNVVAKLERQAARAEVIRRALENVRKATAAKDAELARRAAEASASTTTDYPGVH